MGREIRRVAPGWEHPRKEFPISGPARPGRRSQGRYLPLYDECFEDAVADWLLDLKKWKGSYRDFWEEECPPDPEDFRDVSWTDEEASWFQMYETVSEGTPMSPAFETKQEIVEYLVAQGDYSDQRSDLGSGSPRGPWKREHAERFVEDESALTGSITADGVIRMARDGGG